MEGDLQDPVLPQRQEIHIHVYKINFTVAAAIKLHPLRHCTTLEINYLRMCRHFPERKWVKRDQVPCPSQLATVYYRYYISSLLL